MRCNDDNCICHVNEQARELHGELLEHMKSCIACKRSHGKHELCTVGQILYGRMLAWLVK